MGKIAKRVIAVIGVIVLALILFVGGYVAYLMITYNRIDDGQTLEITRNEAGNVLAAGQDYTVATYNIGFGAYTPDYTFFMDEGIMADGTKTVGEHSVAVSEESVRACTTGAIQVIQDLSPDFLLLQEVDTDSTRSYGVNQKEAFESAFPSMGSAFAVNFHTASLPTRPLSRMASSTPGFWR